MTFDTEILGTHIPYYLTSGQAELVSQLRHFFENGPVNYYTGLYPDEMLQGDGWRGLELLDFASEERKSVRGIVLSNTCDISPDNPRRLPRRIAFAPIIKISSLAELLLGNGQTADQTESFINAIRRQEVTSILFLPASGLLQEDYCALLEHLYSVPAERHENHGEREKIFTLSQLGHYILLFKLSVHFCRFQEEVQRG